MWVLIATILGSSMGFIDATAVNVALPAIGRDLHADSATLAWVVEGYGLFLAAFILVGGALGDRFGRRKVYVGGVTTFALGSLVCAFARSGIELEAARCLQGFGAAILTPGSLAIISAHFSGEKRGEAIGTWSAFAAMTGALGPLLGGWLTQVVSWRAVFLVNIPLAFMVAAVSVMRVPESRNEEHAPVDFFGALLATGALGAITYGLIAIQNAAGSRNAAPSILTGLCLCAAFVVWEARAVHPMLPLGLFRERSFALANLYTFFLYAALGASMFFIPIYLQTAHAYTPTAAGAALLPTILVISLASRWTGKFTSRIGPRLPLAAGAGLAATAFAGYALIGSAGSYWITFFPAAVLLGIAASLFVAPLTTTVMNALEASHAGLASGINNAVARVAGLLAIAVLGTALTAAAGEKLQYEIGSIMLSAAARATVQQDRGMLLAGNIPAALSAHDRERLAPVVRMAYTAGFRFTMQLSALLAGFCVFIALCIPVTSNRRI